MSIRNAAAVMIVAALGSPLLADMPDGRGGRTSPQATPRAAAVTPAPACCHRTLVSVPPRPASAAEKKMVGDVAWSARPGTVSVATECSGGGASAPRTYASGAELKARGHAASAPVVAASCCDSGLCPMRRRS